jgi:hypothetical protein
MYYQIWRVNMQYFVVSATGGRPSVMHAGLYYIYCVSTAKLHSICCYCYRFGYKMSMFVLMYGAIFSLHFFSYKCDGKSLLYIHNISEYTRHTCLSVTVCCMAVRDTSYSCQTVSVCRLLCIPTYCFVYHFKTYNNH